LTLGFPINGRQYVKIWQWEEVFEENIIQNDSFIEVSDDEYKYIKWNQ